jgi:putative spermidine/putrescine transport system substrate-binding protein/spermidine/putrescine transport system substrate-binding protein
MVRKYWGTAGELINLFANGEVWISNTWGGYQSAELEAQGIPVKEFIPKENAEGWMDSWQIVKGSKNQECAYKWINYSISPKGQCGVSGVTGYSSSNPAALKECVDAATFTALHMDDVGYIDSLILWQEPERLEKYINTWNAVKAAQ